MSEPTPQAGSLVLHRNRPARVRRAEKKLEIELEGATVVSVRPKDVVLLHPGPLEDLAELQPAVAEVEIAWELLQGSTVSLDELAELAYGTYTPATAWAAWQLVAEGIYFHGTPQAVVARSPEEVVREQAAREAQAVEEHLWAQFLARVRTSGVRPEDGRYLREVEDLALARGTRSRVLRELGRAESPENAHALLLELGYWDHTVDPYPQRLGLPITPVSAELPQLSSETRVDLTHLPAFAIDDEDSQEPDDALSLDGHRLWVHVADVAALVPPGSAADLEAHARGASLYLPEGTVGMLPQEAIQALGLGLAEVSPALSFGLELDADGRATGLEVMPSWVRVTRLTYAQAEAHLQEGPLQDLYRLAQLHQQRREEQDALSLELPEVKIVVQRGQVVIHPLPPLRSRELVTEAMLMAGEAVARYAIAQGIPIPFVTQDPPPTQDRPTDLAGMVACRRTLRPSQASSRPGPHAGLGLELYTQATSPLRRYLDLVVHQQLRAHLQGRVQLGVPEVLERLGAIAIVTGSIRQAERLARRHWTLVYLMQHPGWHGPGVLVEKRGKRGTVLIPELDLEAQVHLRQDLALNSPLLLALNEVNLAELSVHFRVTG